MVDKQRLTPISQMRSKFFMEKKLSVSSKLEPIFEVVPPPRPVSLLEPKNKRIQKLHLAKNERIFTVNVTISGNMLVEIEAMTCYDL